MQKCGIGLHIPTTLEETAIGKTRRIYFYMRFLFTKFFPRKKLEACAYSFLNLLNFNKV